MADRKPRRGPRKVDAAYLERSALHYLKRFETSRANLRRILMMKVIRSAHVHGTDPGTGEKDVDALLDRLTGAGFLDDARYAESRVASLLRQGHAMARIRMKLLQKGVGESVVQAAIARSQAESGDADLSAAIAYARKRRFGPFRTQGKPDKRDKELAAMMRRGFPFGLSARIIDARNEAALPSPSDDIYEPLP